jgi:integrase
LATDKAEAWQRWHELLAGGPPSDTVGVIATGFLDRPLAPATLAMYRRFLGDFTTRFGTRPANGLTTTEVTAWADRPTWGDGTRWLALTCVAALVNHGVRTGRLSANPLRGLVKPQPRSRGVEVLLDGDGHKRLLAAAPPHFRLALLALHDTGCRPAEVCRVEAKHFDPDAGCWVLPDHKTARKTGRPRVVMLTLVVVELCKELATRHPMGPLFRGRDGGPLKARSLSDWTYKAWKRRGLPRAIPYAYRHGLATDALANGVPEALVAALLGHTNTAMLHRHYAHLGARAAALRSALGQVRG